MDRNTVSQTEEQRRVIFAALVALQDEGVEVSSSREQVARRFGLTPEVVMAIEQEGIAHEWPPL